MSPTRDRASEPPGRAIPPSRALPDVGFSSPASTRRSVVFPAPFGPKTARQSPGASEKVTPATAVRDPNERVSSPTSTMGSAVDKICDCEGGIIRLDLATLARAAQNAVSLRLRQSGDGQLLRAND